MEFLFFSHILPPEWKTVCWCLVFAWLHKRLSAKKKKKLLKNGKMGEEDPVQEPGIPSVCLWRCAIHLFCVYGLQPGSSPVECETCLKRALPREGLGGAGKWLWNSLLCFLCVHSLGERREETFPSTDWLTEVRFHVSQCKKNCTMSSDVLPGWCPPGPPAQIFFFFSILEFGNERCGSKFNTPTWLVSYKGWQSCR